MIEEEVRQRFEAIEKEITGLKSMNKYFAAQINKFLEQLEMLKKWIKGEG